MDLPDACKSASSVDRATFSIMVAVTSGCKTTDISCNPNSLIGFTKEICFRSIEKPAEVATSAASRGETDP